jgi:hypothetical protein
MKTYSITIPDNKENIFIEWMKSVSFVKKIEAISDNDIPDEHKQLVRQRIKRIEDNPESVMSLEDIENKIKL